MTITKSDYFYISIIIILLALIYFVALPIAYTEYNRDIDGGGCVFNENSVRCYEDMTTSLKFCEYNCTFTNGTTVRMRNI